ncbi:hypothetical protein ACOMHN_028320 [Nucella lapillus]
MEASKSTGVKCQLEDLICGLCKDVYKSPRFLRSCYHSFCMQCIENNTAARKSNKFLCPVCGEETTLPEGGAKNLHGNFYLTEEKLAKARKLQQKNSSVCCSVPGEKQIDPVCVTSEMPACEDFTEHGEGHSLRALSELNAKLGEQVHFLQGTLDCTKTEHRNLQEKTSALSRHLRHQKALLRAKVDQQFEASKLELLTITNKGEEKLCQEITRLNMEIKKSQEMQELARDWRKRLRMKDVIDTVKQMKSRMEGEADLLSHDRTGPIPHPGLVSSMHNDVDQALIGFLGQPIEHILPQQSQPPSYCVDDVKIPVQIRLPNAMHEVLCLIPSADCSQIVVTFRAGLSNTHSSVAVFQVKTGVALKTDYNVFQGKAACTFKWFKLESIPVLLHISQDFGVIQISKNNHRMCLFRDNVGYFRLYQVEQKLELKGDNEDREINYSEPEIGRLVMHLDLVDPFNMDASPDGKLYVVIDTQERQPKISRGHQRKRKLEDGMVAEGGSAKGTERCIRQPVVGSVVKLFREGQSQPIDVYRPAKSTFVPSDVCFCRWMKTLLLIADWQNDEVHVVQVRESGFHFKRLLVDRHGELVKISALNTDSKGNVWTGSSNGSLMRFKMKNSLPITLPSPVDTTGSSSTGNDSSRDVSSAHAHMDTP